MNPGTTDGGTERPDATPGAANAAPVSARRFQVLLVDDSAIVCQRLSALIDQLGLPIRVAFAKDGDLAARLFEQVAPDVVVLDLELPRSSGFDLLVQFKQQRPECVIIILTTYAYPEFRDNALRLGANYFFSKAMEFERVTEVLRALAAPAPLAP